MMPTFVNIEPAILKWQARHNRRITREELAEETGISIAALYRLRHARRPDLNKIDRLCEFLECDPGDIIIRTAEH